MTKRTPPLPLGLQIRQARIAAKLTQAELAERAGVDQSDVSKWETGIRTPTVTTLRALSAATGATFVVEANRAASQSPA